MNTKHACTDGNHTQDRPPNSYQGDSSIAILFFVLFLLTPRPQTPAGSALAARDEPPRLVHSASSVICLSSRNQPSDFILSIAQQSANRRISTPFSSPFATLAKIPPVAECLLLWSTSFHPSRGKPRCCLFPTRRGKATFLPETKQASSAPRPSDPSAFVSRLPARVAFV